MSNQEVIAPHFAKFCKFIKDNLRLTHLNLSSTDLPESQLVELIGYIKKNQSLQVVHLCGNSMSLEAKKIMKQKLKVTYIDTSIPKYSEKESLINLINKCLKCN